LNTTIRRADRTEAAVLTAVAHAAKRHWNYPEAWILKWREQLTVTPAYVDEHRVFVVEVDGSIGGFYALRGDGPTVELDHVWVDPKHIGGGLGRRLVEHGMAEARAGGTRSIEIDSDPYAEAFYAHLGARRIGKTPAPMDEEPERYLPRLVLELAD
jgi:GNAT superfamily N-acetyltransferase